MSFIVKYVSLIMIYLNMVDYPMVFLSLSTWTLDTLLTLRATCSFRVGHRIFGTVQSLTSPFTLLHDKDNHLIINFIQA